MLFLDSDAINIVHDAVIMSTAKFVFVGVRDNKNQAIRR